MQPKTCKKFGYSSDHVRGLAPKLLIQFALWQKFVVPRGNSLRFSCS